ncbi:MAG: hypothetical protein ACOX3E_10400 [Desulfomonilia bacterium]
MRRQTLVNAERFITPELKEYEAKVLGAQDAIARIEARIFSELLDFLLGWTPGAQARPPAAIACADTLSLPCLARPGPRVPQAVRDPRQVRA